MAYAYMIERAIARIAHRGQKYGSGDYFTDHIEKVVANVEADKFARFVHIRAAFLHDVIEDTEFTEIDLVDLGVSGEVIALVRKLTHGDGETYGDYIRRIAYDNDATLVKLADLKANLAANPPTSLRERYEWAVKTLSEE